MKRITQLMLILLVIGYVGLRALPVQAGAVPIGGNVTVTDAGLNGNGVYDPDLAVVGSTVYAVWGDSRDDPQYDAFRSIYFAKSSDGGATWGSNIRVGNIQYDDWCDRPRIVVQPDGTIWVVWFLFYKPDANRVNEIRYAKSTDGGNSFTADSLIKSGANYGPTNDGDLWKPEIVWDEQNQRLLLLRNEYYIFDNGKSGFDIVLIGYNAQMQQQFETIINDVDSSGRVGDGSQDDQVPNKSLVVKNGTVCAAWEDNRTGSVRAAIYGACSTDGGTTFAADFIVSGADGIWPRIDLGSDGKLYATYATSTDAKKDIQFRLSADLGKNWSAPVSVTQMASGDDVTYWDMAVDANGMIVVGWTYDYGFRDTDAYFSTSLDQGNNWSNLKVEDGTGQFPTVANQFTPEVAVAGSGANTFASIIWKDNRNSISELFSNAFVLDSIPPTAPGNLKATGGDTSNLLQWDASTDANGIQGYRIYRVTSAGGVYNEISARLVTTTTYRDVGLSNTTYFYKVTAVDGTANTGPTSNEANATASISTDLPVNGTIAYEVKVVPENKTYIRMRSFSDLATERVFAEGFQPRFSADGKFLYYESSESIQARSLTGSEQRIVYAAKGLFNDYDIASFDTVDMLNNEKYVAAIVGRNFASTVTGGFCFVSEPHYFTSGQERFVDDYNYSSEMAISSYPQWLVYRYTGFCNVGATGFTSPGDLCIVNLENNSQNCLKGADYRDPDFAPTKFDNRIVFADKITGQYELWKAELDASGNFRNYVPLTRGAQGITSHSPSWSSDGNWIIFERDIDPAQTENIQLFIMRADGAGLRALNVSGTNPAWAGGGVAIDPRDLTNKIYLPVVTK